MRNLLLVSLLLLEVAAVSAGSYRFRPAEGQGMRNPDYGAPTPQYSAPTPQYSVPMRNTYTDTPRYYDHADSIIGNRSYSQWGIVDSYSDFAPVQPSPGIFPEQDFLSSWELGEPQLFEPPTDLPYVDSYENVIDQGRQPFFTSDSQQRWRGIEWPEQLPGSVSNQAFGDSYRPVEPDEVLQYNSAEQFIPQNSALHSTSPWMRESSFNPHTSQQADVSPGRYSSWR